jgi:hypothetical protein
MLNVTQTQQAPEFRVAHTHGMKLSDLHGELPDVKPLFACRY